MPYCNKCGAQNPDGSAFCSSCGSSMSAQTQESTSYSVPTNYPQNVYTPYQSTAAAPVMPTVAKVLSIVSMACGILSCATLFMGFLFSIAAFVTGGISRSKTPYGVRNTKAKAGLITGIAGIVLSVIWLIIYIALFAEVFEYVGDYYDYGYGNFYDF